ncbi:cupin domain-containing protein [Zooshikella harenae]|uniref:Cupin domain-containing protein n=1 Tax=Zooshikella harenae TaxID=2827238 RepID=A0ABS5ZJB0_9GAMM|nr:cupin domain-containing protein [Zooshikella harenae]MBU2714020.1 cupin domain-containing protein [Zooshikella harenae]
MLQKYKQENSSCEGTYYRLVDYVDNIPFKSSFFVVKPGFISRLDQHSAKEVWMVKQGKGILEYDGQLFSLKAGDTYYFSSNITHQVRNTGTIDIEIFSTWWD